MDKKLYDFYFSQGQKGIILKQGNKINQVKINGEYVGYTETYKKGNTKISKFDDTIFLGSAILYDDMLILNNKKSY